MGNREWGGNGPHSPFPIPYSLFLMLHAWSSAGYTVPLPPGQRVPIEKYALLRDRVIAECLVMPENLHDPERVRTEDLELVHTADYVNRFTHGLLSEHEMRRIGFPWSPALAERSYRAVGGTLAAARHAVRHGVAMNLAGGTHHAFRDHGEGFCVFNDVAVAIRVLQREGVVTRAAVVDLDVHQGNGSHAIFAGDPGVYTFSMHAAHNYPFVKIAGSRDVDLDAGTGDAEYLDKLMDELPRVLAASSPDLVVYLAGADPHESDTLGQLKLTFAGLERRDVMVLEVCRDVGVPVAITIAGGYGRDINDTVHAHLNTVRVARGFS
jgi:acetoin utilization deacetylase AcuC-like enzyme